MVSGDIPTATKLKDPAAAVTPASAAQKRPIPLPPASLRPPPRARVPAREAEPRAVRRTDSLGSEPGALGTRRGFILGLAIPLLGILVGGVLWWWGTGGWHASIPAPGIAAGPGAASDAASRPAAAESAPPAVASAGQLLALQVASFRTRQRAEEVLVQAQNRTGLAGLVIPGDVDGTRWYRILLGTFSSPEEAKRAAEPLLDEGMILDVLVRPVPPRWADAMAGQDIP